MSSIFKRKSKNKFNRSQVLQLQKIKTENDYNENDNENINSSNISCDSESSRILTTRCINNEIYNAYETISLFKNFSIIKKIYEKQEKATYIVIDNITQIKYILKIKHYNYVNSFEYEIYKLLKDNPHENIINFIQFYKENNYYYYLYEYFDGINLFDYLKMYKNNVLKYDDIKNILLQITDALIYLHKYNIIHCDLKLDNIIINNDNKLKVIDFDLSIICDKDEGHIFNNIFGTMQYIAPESYDLGIYSKKSDIWQMGVIMYILITKSFPFDYSLELVNSKSNLCRQNIFKHIDLTVPKDIIINNQYNNFLYDILCKMLSFDDSKRISLNEIKSFMNNN